MADSPPVESLTAHDHRPGMQLNPARVSQLTDALSTVIGRVNAAAKGRPVRVVAVSKLKPATDILALHQAPLRHSHFGENYLQELQTKASLLPASIHWHFIGALQTNKCAALAQIPNLFLVSSLDSAKKADALNKGRARLRQDLLPADSPSEPLRVHVQVNTSGEDSKSGVSPDDALALCAHIRDRCPHLRLQGLMTIGAIARSQATTAESGNEDFETLRRVRDGLLPQLQLPAHTDHADREHFLELSMGMSEDYEGAIIAGSDEVRVGSTIFGARPPKSEAKIIDT